MYLSRTGLAIAIALTTAAWLPASAESATTADVPALLRRAAYRMLDADFPAADALIAQAERLQPEDPAVAFHRAMACWWRALAIEPDGDGSACFDQTETVIELARDRLKADGDDPWAYYYLGRAHGLRARIYGFGYQYRKTVGEMRRAHRYLARAEELEPAIAAVSVDMGLYKYMATQLPAIAQVVRVLLFLPGGDREEGLRRLATVASGSGLDAEEARIYLAAIDLRYENKVDRAIGAMIVLRERFPHNVYAHLHLARALRRQTWQLHDALAVYREAQGLVERDTKPERWARMGIGMTLLELGDLNRAEQLLESVQHDRDSTGDEAMRGLVRIAALRGQTAKAWRIYRELAARERDIAQRYARWALGELQKATPEGEVAFRAILQQVRDHEQRGDTAAVAAAWRAALGVRPSDPRALDGLARLAQEAGRKEAARSLYEQVAARDDAGSELVARARFGLAQLHRADGDGVTAAELYASIEEFPGLPLLKEAARCERVELVRQAFPGRSESGQTPDVAP